jgi:ribosomal protein L15E
MKLNSPESIKEAAKVFRSYGGSWTAARAAGQRDKDGVLVIPLNTARGGEDERARDADHRRDRKAG